MRMPENMPDSGHGKDHINHKDGNKKRKYFLQQRHTNLPPIVITKEDRVKYFEFLRNNDSIGLAKWLKDLSIIEEDRMKKFGYYI